MIIKRRQEQRAFWLLYDYTESVYVTVCAHFVAIYSPARRCYFLSLCRVIQQQCTGSLLCVFFYFYYYYSSTAPTHISRSALHVEEDTLNCGASALVVGIWPRGLMPRIHIAAHKYVLRATRLL